MKNLLAWIFIGFGIFAISGALFDWDWYMNHRKARFLVRILSRNGARVVYMLIGLFLLGLGLASVTGMIGPLERTR